MQTDSQTEAIHKSNVRLRRSNVNDSIHEYLSLKYCCAAVLLCCCEL
jgi:hypothetical protein